jgi:pimeloyl-ACP methyl ester carboxylesterase
VPHIKAGDIRIYYEIHGAGKQTLTLIRGLGSDLSAWSPQIPEFSKHFRTVVFDNRGAGRTDKPDGPYSIRQMAQDVNNLLEAVNIQRTALLGISMGGMIAQELVLAHPERVRALTLGCTYCGGEGSKLASDETMRRLAAGMASGDRERAIRTAWEVNVSPAFAANEDVYATFLARGLRYGVALPVIMEQMRAITEHATSTRLPDVNAPTLVIHGTLDQLLPIENGHMIASLVPGARLEILEGIGHMFFLEEPARTAKLVREHALVNA